MCVCLFFNGEVKFYSPISLPLVYLLSFSLSLQVTILVSMASVITVVRASQRVQRAR